MLLGMFRDLMTDLNEDLNCWMSVASLSYEAICAANVANLNQIWNLKFSKP